MLYVVTGLVVLISIALAMYAVINKSERIAQIAALQKELEEQELRSTGEIDVIHRELAKLEKIRHIPNVIEKSRKLEAEITGKLAQAQREADEAVLVAHQEIERMKARIASRSDEAEQRAFEIVKEATQEAKTLRIEILGKATSDAEKAKETLRIAEWQANNLLEQAQKQAREIASQARKDVKEKTAKADEVLARVTAYAIEIRMKAEARAREIGGEGYDALKRHAFYKAAAEAMENVVSGYGKTYMVPAAHVLDELAEEYGFNKAGERLKVARERSRVMENKGAAADCNYPEGWKRDYAINFVLGAFNGKVDSILARLKPANQGKLIQEIKDVYALANHNGEVFKNARIHEEYLDSRLEELKWAVAVQRVKEKDREEQRAIREQIREDEKARKEIEKAVKQAEREEATIAKALERARQEYESANLEDRAKYEARLEDLAFKLRDAEEKNQRAMSMAQQTKRGNVYVISNIGSFGEDVFKIGLTRRLEPLERVRELGDASVPFGFDVHAMIPSEDAPALESDLHRRFLQKQVNKVNRRKEFFRVTLKEIRSVVEELAPDVRWTMAAEARDYRDSLVLEQKMREDAGFRKQWTESEAAYESRETFDDEAELDDQVALVEERN